MRFRTKILLLSTSGVLLASTMIVAAVVRQNRVLDERVSTQMTAQARSECGKIAKDVFEKMWTSGRGAKEIVASEGLVQVTDSGAIEAACRVAVAANPKQAEGYRAGKAQLLGYFVGQVMKATQGKANPEMVNQFLKELLK